MNVLTPSPYLASSPSVDDLRLCLEQARREAEQSSRALDSVADGIRALKRILETTSSGEDTSIIKGVSEDLHQVYQLSDSLQGVLGSDFLALVNAADMLREHSRLAFQETSDVVADLRKAKLEAQSAIVTATHAAKEVQALSRTNSDLKSQVRKLRHEKRVLVKEIKAMREQAAEQLLMEQHVLKSLTVHELVLKTPPSVTLRKTYFDEDDRDAETAVGGQLVDSGLEAGGGQSLDTAGLDVVSESTTEEENRSRKGKGFKRGFLVFRRSNKPPKEDVNGLVKPEDIQNPKKDKDDGLLRGFGTPTRHFPKSHLPGLDEISTFTDDSSAARVLDKEVKREEEKCQGIVGGPPRVVTKCNTVSQPSPLVTPEGVPPPDYESLGDPHILRTLEIPSSLDDAQLHFLSPRRKITESLYEC